ncbi:hypothetical protein PFICI_15001 [Pestalotiopsis fici W106-1]|uniref:Uncharacterized protein n=1 Tax=Pestalotiopsis fici (strain W106-1 / CGMCC3.15140) TaxID=1229662 RepID=W3WKP8_PESFW|nr:uncharacterized protein PFICI_15001 [Pestalotiopsis fici W106-1]ETS73396.1 hypothetical protein PFICI_15001 [Pestalotiopsis fici W106-1]
MEVVRVLVEHGHSNVNAQSRAGENEFDRDVAPHLYLSEDEISRVAGRNTALHEVAKGCHWWQVGQALPYLLSMGADKQKGNEEGASPLDLSLAWRKRYIDFSVPETFAHEARALLRED